MLLRSGTAQLLLAADDEPNSLAQLQRDPLAWCPDGARSPVTHHTGPCAASVNTQEKTGRWLARTVRRQLLAPVELGANQWRLAVLFQKHRHISVCIAPGQKTRLIQHDVLAVIGWCLLVWRLTGASSCPNPMPPRGACHEYRCVALVNTPTHCEIVCWGVILAISAGPTPCMYQYSGYRAGRSSGQCHTGRTTLITPSVHTSASLFGYLYLGPCTRPTATQPNRDVTTHYCWPVHTSCMPASRSYVKT